MGSTQTLKGQVDHILSLVSALGVCEPSDGNEAAPSKLLNQGRLVRSSARGIQTSPCEQYGWLGTRDKVSNALPSKRNKEKAIPLQNASTNSHQQPTTTKRGNPLRGNCTITHRILQAENYGVSEHKRPRDRLVSILVSPVKPTTKWPKNGHTLVSHVAFPRHPGH